jgi:hypothetical protein
MVPASKCFVSIVWILIDCLFQEHGHIAWLGANVAATLPHIELAAGSGLLGPTEFREVVVPGVRKTTKTSLRLPDF